MDQCPHHPVRRRHRPPPGPRSQTRRRRLRFPVLALTSFGQHGHRPPRRVAERYSGRVSGFGRPAAPRAIAKVLVYRPLAQPETFPWNEEGEVQDCVSVCDL